MPCAVRIEFVDWPLFVRKTVAVFALTLLLVPLLELKSALPARAYLAGLVLLHLGVLAIYLYRVRLRDVAPDARALLARVAALALVSVPLALVSQFEPGTPTATLLAQALVVAMLHEIVLLLLMARVVRRAPRGEGRTRTFS